MNKHLPTDANPSLARPSRRELLTALGVFGAVVKAVARRHGARMEVGESAGLGGARVEVSWPAP